MLNEFKRYLEDDSVSENTIMSYISDVTIFLKFFKDKFGEEIIQLEHIVITEYIKELKNASRKSNTINRKLSALCKYNNFLIQKGIQENIVIKPKDYVKQQAKLMAPYSPTEKELLKLKLCAKESKRDIAIITTFAHGGLRVSELINLEQTDLNFESRSIVVRGKGNKVRIVVMADVVYDALQDYLDERDKERNFIKEQVCIYR